jgi:hypothetical protein
VTEHPAKHPKISARAGKNPAPTFGAALLHELKTRLKDSRLLLKGLDRSTSLEFLFSAGVGISPCVVRRPSSYNNFLHKILVFADFSN